MAKLTRNALAAVGVVALVLASGFVYYYEAYYLPQRPACDPIAPGSISRTQLSSVTFGAVTEYKLPSQGRWPNAVTTAPDGSVWFAEEEIPGVGHLYPGNGTLVEYAWPGYATPSPRTACTLPARRGSRSGTAGSGSPTSMGMRSLG